MDCIYKLAEKGSDFTEQRVDDWLHGMDDLEYVVMEEFMHDIRESGIGKLGVDDYPAWWIEKGYFADGASTRDKNGYTEYYYEEYGWLSRGEYARKKRAKDEHRWESKGRLIG